MRKAPLKRQRAVLVLGALMSAVLTVLAQPGAGDAARNPYIGETSRLSTEDMLVGRRRFEPGGRSSWHIHPGGQLLFIEEGRGRVQRRGEPVRELTAGESDFTGPGVPHWHGAAPDSHAIQSSISYGGIGPWLEPVTDAEYLGAEVSRDE